MGCLIFQGGAPKIAKLPYKWFYGRYNELVTGSYIFHGLKTNDHIWAHPEPTLFKMFATWVSPVLFAGPRIGSPAQRGPKVRELSAKGKESDADACHRSYLYICRVDLG